MASFADIFQVFRGLNPPELIFLLRPKQIPEVKGAFLVLRQDAVCRPT